VRRGGSRRYPRTARVNELLREVIAEEVERIDDERLGLATVTGVTADPDLRHASVWFASLSDDAAEALAEYRPRLQAAIGRQVRMKRTPELAFRPDPAVSSAQRVEEILRGFQDQDRDE
jgi:ribosome-binding factor A